MQCVSGLWRDLYTVIDTGTQASQPGDVKMSFQAMAWAINQKLPTNEKFVLIMIANYANDRGFCWPSIKTLSDNTGLSRSSVKRIIGKLIKDNVIEVKPRKLAMGNFTSNMYKIIVTPTADLDHKLSISQCVVDDDTFVGGRFT